MIRGSLRSADGVGVVHLEASLDRSVDDVWAALTDPESLSQWLGKIDGDLRPGGEFRAYFFATGWEGTGHVDACEAPQLLRILTKSEGEPDCVIEITLAADGERSSVAFEDRGLPLEQIAATEQETRSSSKILPPTSMDRTAATLGRDGRSSTPPTRIWPPTSLEHRATAPRCRSGEWL
jgi:uncharacterized protein YndB with AHSA1/START domain